jgi:hypothetical protein
MWTVLDREFDVFRSEILLSSKSIPLADDEDHCVDCWQTHDPRVG